MSDISLSKAVRSNLLSLQNTATMMSKTQERLATGNKVNSALDNPTNYFTASALNSRAGDINQLLDGMNNGIQTLQAADNGLKAITKTLESMQSTLRQARQDKSFETMSFKIGDVDTGAVQTIKISGGQLSAEASFDLNTVAAAATPASLTGSAAHADAAALNTALAGSTDTLSISTVGGDEPALEIDLTDVSTLAELQAKFNNTDYTVGATATNQLVISRADGTNFSVSGAAAETFGLAAATNNGKPVSQATVRGLDALVEEINTELAGKVRASNDNGSLRIENLSTTKLEIEGLTDGKLTGGVGKAEIGGNKVRSDLAAQFRDLRDQLDKLADDASFNGINLLRGDNLQITFNETATSELNIRSKDAQGISSSILGLETNLEASQLDSDTDIDTLIANVKSAINDVRSQSSAFGSSLSVVQNRQDFSKNMINTLQTGAANLTLADMNEEAANLLALQTRQSLSSSALSMASQADQSVLQLLR